MVRIRVKKGLDIPLRGEPKPPGDRIEELPAPPQVALDLSPFATVRFKILVKREERVKAGQVIAYDKGCTERTWVAPASGVIKDIVRGEKRQPRYLVIERSREQEEQEYDPVELSKVSREELVEALLQAGLFPRIRQRPCNLLADPKATPRATYIKAVETAPFAPSAELQMQGREAEFAVGVAALQKLTAGPVHLVAHANSTAFTHTPGVEYHTVEGPHPAANHSVHIHYIDPIRAHTEVVWTLTARDVADIGHFLQSGRHHFMRVISIAGEGVQPEKRGFFRVHEGHPVGALVAGRLEPGEQRFVGGDVLTGQALRIEDYLGYYDTGLVVLPEREKREFLHFFRLGGKKFTNSGAYLSGHGKNRQKKYSFTTSRHGEPRAFITNIPYDKVMPMNIPTVPLVKAVMAEDYDLAEALGMLEVASEDFALSTFVCPSKIEISKIMGEGLQAYAEETL